MAGFKQQRRDQARPGETCAFCGQPVGGAQVVRGLTREPYHPACRGVSRSVERPAPSRADSPIRLAPVHAPCPTCGQDVDGSDPTRQGVRHHRECLM